MFLPWLAILILQGPISSWKCQGEVSTQSSLPEIIEEETNQITTVVIFVISAILTITLLFMIAIFIDCRQQKLQLLKAKQPRRALRLKLPPIRIGRTIREDQATIADKMEQPQPSSSNVIV